MADTVKGLSILIAGVSRKLVVLREEPSTCIPRRPP